MTNKEVFYTVSILLTSTIHSKKLFSNKVKYNLKYIEYFLPIHLSHPFRIKKMVVGYNTLRLVAADMERTAGAHKNDMLHPAADYTVAPNDYHHSHNPLPLPSRLDLAPKYTAYHNLASDVASLACKAFDSTDLASLAADKT